MNPALLSDKYKRVYYILSCHGRQWMKQEVLRMKKGHLDAFLIGQTATAVEAMQKIDFNLMIC